MARRSNSRETIDSIHEYIDACIATRAEDFFADEPIALMPDAWHMGQIFRMEKGEDIARFGERQAFDAWIEGLGFAPDYQSYADTRSVVESWLNQTPEESARYSDEQVCDLFKNLLYREFKNMEASCEPEGWRAEILPQKDHLESVVIYNGKELVAHVTPESLRDARYLAKTLECQFILNEKMPYCFTELGLNGKDLNEALVAYANNSRPYYDSLHDLQDKWARNVIGDDAYYFASEKIYKAIQNDLNLPVMQQELLDKQLQIHFDNEVKPAFAHRQIYNPNAQWQTAAVYKTQLVGQRENTRTGEIVDSPCTTPIEPFKDANGHEYYKLTAPEGLQGVIDDEFVDLEKWTTNIPKSQVTFDQSLDACTAHFHTSGNQTLRFTDGKKATEVSLEDFLLSQHALNTHVSRMKDKAPSMEAPHISTEREKTPAVPDFERAKEVARDQGRTDPRVVRTQSK